MKTPMLKSVRRHHQHPQLLSSVFDEPRQPTEEDLLYMLIARSRDRDEDCTELAVGRKGI